MFQNSGLFKNIPCPNGPDKCKLPNCIFLHSFKIQADPPNEPKNDRVLDTSGHDFEGASSDKKRLKLENGQKHVPSSEQVEQCARPGARPAIQPFVGDLSAKPAALKASTSATKFGIQNVVGSGDKAKIPASITRPISPPISSLSLKPTSNGKGVPLIVSTKQKADRVEVLNPRMIAKPPAAFQVRYAILKKLHEVMARLNNEIAKSSDKATSALCLSDNELIRAALDEEEQVAIGQTSIYTNVIKMRILKYQKMQVEEWKELRLQAIKKEQEKNKPMVEKPIQAATPGPVKTGLSSNQELLVLKGFILSPAQLKQAGYIISAPTDAEIAEVRKIASMGMEYEDCDRCGTRFQVFPERREDGALTSNGKCIHHWGKAVFPPREKTGMATSKSREQMYLCCNTPVGSPGCTAGATHVFKTTSPRRLAYVLQFQETPLNFNAKKDLAVVFDCEMGYTTHGLELIRFSATSWPNGEDLIDVLVRPIGQILDLNTRYSGVTSEQFLDAVEFDPDLETVPPLFKDNEGSKERLPLRIVPSPAAARSLLFSYINPETVLIGHALDNDVNVMRIIHPSIVDTSLLFAHPAGLPYRYGLRRLAKDFLHLDIQTAGAAGHDSLEDSRATGELVRLKIAREWEELSKKGWTIKDENFYAPGQPDEPSPLPSYSKSQGHISKKRKAETDGVVPLGGSVVLKEFQQNSLNGEHASK